VNINELLTVGLSFDGSSNGYSGWNTIDTGIFVQEYEALTVEAYWESRVITIRFDNDMHPFFYVHCKKTYLSKNMTSYHSMFNQCKVYKVIECSVKDVPNVGEEQPRRTSQNSQKIREGVSVQYSLQAICTREEENNR
jgi:hypothetical protein